MTLTRRLAFVVSMALGGSFVLAAVVAAAGPGGGLGPGAYSFTSKDVNATFGTLRGGPPSQGFSVSVDQGLNSFRPKDPKGPRTVMTGTIVSLTLFDDAGNYSYGCFTINPSDFTVSKDLQTARVHTTLTADEICPGFGAPLAGQTGVSPFAAGGGGGTDLPLPIVLDVTWSGLGVTSTGTDRNTFQCLDYSTQFSTIYHSSNASASGTMSAITGTSGTSLAVVSSSATTATVKGTPQSTCFAQ
ncbi:MAG: hypothetical protein QOJ10_481 [Chloroflexota bacterium]|nr:hypothetical protein [Chloroflexota bacterium]